MGAWIETFARMYLQNYAKSHPMWVRGLKLSCLLLIILLFCVAPYVGAWIETPYSTPPFRLEVVAPYVGAWIETNKTLNSYGNVLRRTLCGCVD